MHHDGANGNLTSGRPAVRVLPRLRGEPYFRGIQFTAWGGVAIIRPCWAAPPGGASTRRAHSSRPTVDQASRVRSDHPPKPHTAREDGAPPRAGGREDDAGSPRGLIVPLAAAWRYPERARTRHQPEDGLFGKNGTRYGSGRGSRSARNYSPRVAIGVDSVLTQTREVESIVLTLT